MGNLEAADGLATDNFDKAAKYLDRAIEIRLAAGDSANSVLAISYLCRSRVHFLQKRYDDALRVLIQSETMYYRLSGANAPVMAQ